MRYLIIFCCCMLVVRTQVSPAVEEAMRKTLIEVDKRQEVLKQEVQKLKDTMIKPFEVELGKVSLDIETAFNESKSLAIENIKTLSAINGASKAGSPVFFARRETPFNTNETIVSYDSVLVNIGNGLNPDTGLFTAPLKGIYFFYFSASKKWGDVHMTIQVLHNDEIVTSKIVSAGDRQNAANSASNLEVQISLELEAGDTVCIYLYSGAIYDAKLSTNEFVDKSTTFSGFLIQKQ